MSSSIFNFRVIGLALGLIVLFEAVCALALRPGLSERANLGSLVQFYDAVIFGKLAAFEQSSPDVVQIGDSSGFHGVRPEVVMSHLGGLKYVNLSCCAPMGYRGYYGIADFMLRRNPGIKAIVLYLSLNNLPRADLIGADHQVGETIQLLTTPFAYVSLPTLALRHKIIEIVRSKTVSRRIEDFISNMSRSTRRHYGWWPEHDRRLAGPRRADYWRQTCGETGVAYRNDADIFHGHDLFHGQQPYMFTELQRFALLAADHGAKLVVLFHPFSCRGLEGTLLTDRREDLRALMKRHDNVIALPEQMLELWPTEKFVSADHLRVGYDEENSHRVGRMLAQALGIRRDGGPPGPADVAAPTAADAPEPARSTHLQWRSDGALLTPDDGHGEPAGARLLVESAGPGLHGVEATLAGVKPGATAILSFPARAIGARGILVELRTGGRYGVGYCDLYGGSAQRDGDMLDVGIDVQSDGWSRCWVAMVVDAPTVALRLSLIDERLEPAYVGDGRSGAAIGDIEVRQAAHFVDKEPSPW